MRTYRTEFPDFVLDVQLPKGFMDCSWKNDSRPSFKRELLTGGRHLYLWIDYTDPAKRETTGCPRFEVSVTDVYDDEHAWLMFTETWPAVLAMVREYFPE